MTKTVFITMTMYFLAFTWFLIQPVFNMDNFIIVSVFGGIFFVNILMEVILFAYKKEEV